MFKGLKLRHSTEEPFEFVGLGRNLRGRHPGEPRIMPGAGAGIREGDWRAIAKRLQPPEETHIMLKSDR